MILALISRYLVAGLCALLALALAAVGVQTFRLKSLQAETSNAVADALKKARENEAEWDRITGAINDAREVQLRAVTAERDRFSSELRKRPLNRLPPAARAACSGSTGTELAAPDAGFLEGYGAFARSLQIELEACYNREAVGR